MQDTDKSSLSPYQNAILTEMGISSWTLVKGQGAQQKQEAKDDPVMTPVSGTTKPDLRQTSSTDNALARLAEMKNSKTNGNGSNVHKEPQKASQTVKSEILPKTLLSTDKVL
ncbi:hypothetical protein, partial [Paraglaciecola sp.]|uniref:hypothetical protein n=1 Tax=Paraglaciecola sp. TaxID=1920173 RepID=UPI003EF9F0D6